MLYDAFTTRCLAESTSEAERAHLRDLRAHQVARDLYRQSHAVAQIRKLWALLTGRPYELLDLAEMARKRRVSHRSYAGSRVVPIAQIRGSEGRSKDFDAAFHTLRPHNRERWLSAAMALLLGSGLPAVELVQMDNIYFVRDGHHRISATRALGQSYVDAVVTVWHVEEPMPQEQRTRIADLGAVTG